MKRSFKALEKRAFAWDQILQTNGCSIMTTAHVTLLSPSQNYWPQKAFLWFPGPPSPDLSLCDFYLFPKLKNVLKGRLFGTLENTQKSVTGMLKTIPVEDFQRCYQKRDQRLLQCVAEGDNIDVWIKIKTLVNKKSISLLFCHNSYIYIKCYNTFLVFTKCVFIHSFNTLWHWIILGAMINDRMFN